MGDIADWIIENGMISDAEEDYGWGVEKDFNHYSKRRQMAKVKKRTPPDVLKSRRSSPQSSSATSDFKLPTKRSTPMEELGDFNWLIFGDKKIGKTTLTAQFPDAFHAMWEPGGKALKIYQSSFASWIDFKKAVRLLKKDKTFTTTIIDTVDLAFKASSDEACSRLGIDDPADADWGKGWRAVRNEFESQIQKLLSYKSVVFVSHADMREIKKRDGSSFDTLTSTMSKQARDVIEGIVDIWACYTYDGNDRVLVIEGGEDVAAGHRLIHHFRYTDGTPIRAIPMGHSAEEGYGNLKLAFNNKLKRTVKTKKSSPKMKVKKRS